MTSKKISKNAFDDSSFHLSKETLDSLKNISPTAFASVIFGASINKDSAALNQISTYLMDSTAGISNAMMPNGKSIMGKEYAVTAFDNTSGKSVEVKGKNYVISMLAEHLRESEPDALASMVKNTKVGHTAVSALVYALSRMQDVDFYKSTSIGLLKSISHPEHALEALFKLQGVRPISNDSPVKEIKEAVLAHWMASDTFCDSLAKYVVKERTSQPSKENPLFNALNDINPSIWPLSKNLQNVLIDHFAAEAYQSLGTEFWRNKFVKKMSPKEQKICNPSNPKGELVNAREYLQEYAKRSGPVPEFVTNAARGVLINSTADPETWKALEPLQERVMREGGNSFWQFGFWPKSSNAMPQSDEETLVKLVKKYAAVDKDAASEALKHCLQEREYGRSAVVVFEKAALELLSADAHSDIFNTRLQKVDAAQGAKLQDAIRARDARVVVKSVTTLNASPPCESSHNNTKKIKLF